MEEGFKAYISGKVNRPIHYTTLYKEDGKGGLIQHHKWQDEAVALQQSYFKVNKIDLETIYLQMLVFKIENEKLLKEGKDINSYGINPTKSIQVREEFLRSQLGDTYDDWCKAQKKALKIEYLKREQEKCDKKIEELLPLIKDYSDKSQELDELTDYCRGGLTEEEEKEVDKSLTEVEAELKKEMQKKNGIVAKLKELGEEK